MKKRFIIYIVYLFIGVCIASCVHADIVPPDSHQLERCVTITNIDDFDNFYIIGHITGPTTNGYENYIFKQNTCLELGYKFNAVKIFAVEKSYADLVGIEVLDVSDMHLYGADDIVNPYGGLVDNGDPLVKERIEYAISDISDDTVTLYESKHVSEYNDGTATRIDTFSPRQKNDSKPIQEENTKIEPQPIVPQRKGFWVTIKCFFKRLFGSSC
ncbi:MAG: hypothetical protein V1652_04305 [bacterium]